MPLPISILPIIERWDCNQCGVCCRGSTIPLNESDLAKLESQNWREHDNFRGVRIVESHGRRGQQLTKQADGSCVFLSREGLCRIHQQFGHEAKPLVCRMFPLQVVNHERQAVLTLRRACPTAAADRGRELTEHLPAAGALISEGNLAAQATSPPAIKPCETPDWKRARLLLETLQRLLTDERYPPIRRLVHGVELCRLIEQAQTGALANNKLGDLLRVLEENIADEAAPYFADRARPTSGARVLMRQVGLEVARLHPDFRDRPRWSSRFKLAYWAGAMVVGRGNLPRVVESFAPATFGELEKPLGRTEAAAHVPLGRYVETTATSYQYALLQKDSWSIVESFRQLALLYATSLWLVRWSSAGRSITVDDMVAIVSAIDRAQGYAPLAGVKQRFRLRTLAATEQLSVLLAWYGR